LKNLVEAQHKDNLKFEIHTLPVIKNMVKVNKIKPFKLELGLSAETSGGMMMLVTKDKV